MSSSKNRQNQEGTTGITENHYGPDLRQAFPEKIKLDTLLSVICINM
jgi:hypothetical protein